MEDEEEVILEEGKKEWEPEDLVEIVDDEDEPLVAKVVSEGDAQKAARSRSQKRFDQLTAQRGEAERVAAERGAENAVLQERLNRLENGATRQSLDQFKSDYQTNRAALTKAVEEGDTAAQVKHMEAMTDMRAAARVADSQRTQARPRPAVPQQQAQPVESPVPQKANAWWDRNRWFNSPEHSGESAYARAIDQQLDAEGFNKEDDEYYAELDSRLQSKFPELYSKTPRSPTVPSKGKGGAPRPKDGRIRLTASQMDVARTLGITGEIGLREYAKEISLQEKAQ
jgi:hypothetical protein